MSHSLHNGPTRQAASYCRVSTDKDDQLNSFAAQQAYFREYIGQRPDMELYRIYADEGISGTTTKHRVEFNRMMEDARRGKFQVILTKEVSRFSRNILDTIRFTRELKQLGVAVIFLTDGINTLDPDAELRLTIMASIAQEESRRTSGRVTWGQTRQMERGVVFGRSLLGYDVKNGAIKLNVEGAETVRTIFYKYAVEQQGTSQIARYLTENRICTSTGRREWKSSTVIKILKNEKYVGDLVQKKTYTPDYLTHAKKINKGEVPQVIIRNHHEPIIGRELWNMAQLRLQRNNKRGGTDRTCSGLFAFSGKIICGECGSVFVCRTRKRVDGAQVRRWQCSRAAAGGKNACAVGKQLGNDAAYELIFLALDRLALNPKELAASLSDLIVRAQAASDAVNNKRLQRMDAEYRQLQRKKDKALDSFLSGTISEEELHRVRMLYDGQLKTVSERQTKVKAAISPRSICEKELEDQIKRLLDGQEGRELLVRYLVEQILVCGDRHVEVKLKYLSAPFCFCEERR